MSEAENKKIGQSFIFSFYNECMALLVVYSNYINVLAEIDNLTDPNKLEDNSKAIVLQSLQQVRQSVSVTYIMLQSIKENIKASETDKIKELYDRIKKDFVIKSEDLEDYVIRINKIIASEIMQNILINNKDIVESIYGREK